MESKEVEESKEVVVKPEESLVQKLGEAVDILKRKVAALQERNKILLAKTKEQAAALGAKSVGSGKSFYEKVKSWFAPKPLPDVLVYLESGRVIEGKLGKMDDDFLTVREASLYSSSSQEFPEFTMKSYKIAIENIALIGER